MSRIDTATASQTPPPQQQQTTEKTPAPTAIDRLSQDLTGGAGDSAGKPQDKPAEKPAEQPAAAPDAALMQQVEKLVNDRVSQFVADHMAKQQINAETKARRDAFVNSDESGIKKYPQIYQDLLGDDPKKWPQEAKQIVKRFEADFKGLGGKTEDVGGANRDGGVTPVEESHRLPPSATPEDKISASLAKP